MFFEHKNKNQTDYIINVDVCPNGSKCADQACRYSEWKHQSLSQVMCKFQANCNRLNCVYKHIMDRKAFLGVSISNLKGK